MFSKIRKIGLALVVIFVVVFGTGAGCSKTTTTTSNTILVWGFDDPDVFQPIIRDFQAQYKGYTIKYVKKTLDDDYELNSLNAIAAGQGPDVWTIPSDWMVRHKDKLVAYAKVKGASDPASKVNEDTYFLPVVKQAVKLDNKYYGMTPAVDALRIFYNPKLLQTAKDDFDKQNAKGNKDLVKKVDALIDKGPLFWDDIVTLTQALTIKNGEQVTRSFLAMGDAKNIQEANDIFYLLMLQNKTKFTTDDLQTAIFNLPTATATGASVTPAAKALDFYTSFSNPANANYTWNKSSGSDIDAFVNNRSIAIVNYQSYSDTLAQRFPTFTAKQWPIPQVLSSNNQEVTDYARMNIMTVPTASKNQVNAWNFIKFTSAVDQDNYTSATKRAGSKTSATYKDAGLDDRLGVSPNAVEKYTAQVLYKSRFPKNYDAAINSAIDDTVFGRLPAQKALDLASDKITLLLRNKGY